MLTVCKRLPESTWILPCAIITSLEHFSMINLSHFEITPLRIITLKQLKFLLWKLKWKRWKKNGWVSPEKHKFLQERKFVHNLLKEPSGFIYSSSGAGPRVLSSEWNLMPPIHRVHVLMVGWLVDSEVMSKALTWAEVRSEIAMYCISYGHQWYTFIHDGIEFPCGLDSLFVLHAELIHFKHVNT